LYIPSWRAFSLNFKNRGAAIAIAAFADARYYGRALAREAGTLRRAHHAWWCRRQWW
jgi:hypothetical protein